MRFELFRSRLRRGWRQRFHFPAAASQTLEFVQPSSRDAGEWNKRGDGGKVSGDAVPRGSSRRGGLWTRRQNFGEDP